jgi:hypothetical protein
MYAAILFGGLLKVYDDMVDNPIIAQYSTSNMMEIVKALIIASFTYASMHNMNLPIFIFMGEYLHCTISDDKANNTYFYHAGMMIALILSMITFDISKCSLILINNILLFMIVGHIDHTLFPEEYSWRKIIVRTFYVIFLMMALQLPIFAEHYDIFLFCSGYFMTSVLIMIYSQYNESNQTIEKYKDKIHPDTVKVDQEEGSSESDKNADKMD